MHKHLIFALCLGLAAASFACTSSDDEDADVTLQWMEGQAPPNEVTAGQPFQVQWTITGGVEVEHTNLHSCPATEPACKAPSDGGTRVDGEVLQGVPGSEPFTQMYILPPGEWIVKLHARVIETDGGEGKNNFLSIPGNGTVTSTGVMMLVQPAEEGLTTNTDITTTFAAGPGAVSEGMFQACETTDTACDTPVAEGSVVANGDRWDGTIQVSEAGTYNFVVSAMVDGTEYTHSVERTVQ